MINPGLTETYRPRAVSESTELEEPVANQLIYQEDDGAANVVKNPGTSFGL